MSFMAGYYFGKNGYKLEEACPVAVVAGILILGGAIYVLAKEKVDEVVNDPKPITIEQTTTFSPGEHIIAMPIEDPTKSIQTYEGHPGYKPVGISTAAYGKYGYSYGGGYILFENVVDVEAPVTEVDEEGNYIYGTFGTPVNTETKTLGENEYNPYELIVSVPCDDLSSKGMQIDYYDGYDVVGIGTSSYGQYGNSNGGGCILYTNIEPVEYVYEENAYFGTPIEKQKVLEK